MTIAYGWTPLRRLRLLIRARAPDPSRMMVDGSGVVLTVAMVIPPMVSIGPNPSVALSQFAVPVDCQPFDHWAVKLRSTVLPNPQNSWLSQSTVPEKSALVIWPLALIGLLSVAGSRNATRCTVPVAVPCHCAVQLGDISVGQSGQVPLWE